MLGSVLSGDCVILWYPKVVKTEQIDTSGTLVSHIQLNKSPTPHPPPPLQWRWGEGRGGAWAWASHEIDYIYYMRQSGFSKPSRVKLYADKRRGGDYSSGGLFGCCGWGRVSEPSAPGIRRATKEIKKN